MMWSKGRGCDGPSRDWSQWAFNTGPRGVGSPGSVRHMPTWLWDKVEDLVAHLVAGWPQSWQRSSHLPVGKLCPWKDAPRFQPESLACKTSGLTPDLRYSGFFSTFLAIDFYTLLIFYLFIWLHQVLVAAWGIFSCGVWNLSCGMWDLVPCVHA